MLLLPPLESLRFFEAAARQQSFARGAEELGVTAAAVAHRVRLLEKHLDVPLFDRRPRGVRLNRRGQAYLKEVQRILSPRSTVSPRSGSFPGSPPSRRRTPASLSWKPTTAASTPTAATSTPGSPTPARQRRRAR